ncbi:hypothetical protein NUW54_g6157 [Trametes sanguinea]|uniref:Uncharacterized protein n=1 Tax=Trametes sanguinea TaxID=158606 RepID=A0ACC1PT41_9APHY|nr:hypothetical protein NUW54_g6157 [Trametes sanguinea]
MDSFVCLTILSDLASDPGNALTSDFLGPTLRKHAATTIRFLYSLTCPTLSESYLDRQQVWQHRCTKPFLLFVTLIPIYCLCDAVFLAKEVGRLLGQPMHDPCRSEKEIAPGLHLTSERRELRLTTVKSLRATTLWKQRVHFLYSTLPVLILLTSMKKAVAGFILTAFSARYANADVTTLYIPGYDPQAVTADIEGVDASGHTTWRLGPGVPSGTFTGNGGMELASITLVEGPTDAHLVESDPMISFLAVEDCGFSGGIAVCTVSGHAQDESLTDTETETISGFAVQFGGVPATLTATRTSDGTSTITGSSTGVTTPTTVAKTAGKTDADVVATGGEERFDGPASFCEASASSKSTSITSLFTSCVGAAAADAVFCCKSPSDFLIDRSRCSLRDVRFVA